MRFLSVCSGIAADHLAWAPLGWECAGFAEINKHANAVLAEHYPDVPNFGDFTTIGADDVGRVDLLAGGTPCQAFSVAGGHAGLDDHRGNLALGFCQLARRVRARWVVWENVPGVFSIDCGEAFRSIVEGLHQCGYSTFWRILDAQFVRVESHPHAVPQRRRRLFLVGYLGDWRPPVAALLEPEGMRGDNPPGKKKRATAADTHGAAPGEGGEHGPGLDPERVAPTLTAGSGTVTAKWSKGSGGPSGDECQNLVPFDLSSVGMRGVGNPEPGAVCHTLTRGTLPAVASNWLVRRLTPLECERLMGFPDGYTGGLYKGKPRRNGPRYELLGNSISVNCMSWVGHRIHLVNQIIR